MDFSVKARELVYDQTHEWDLADKNYQSLSKVRVKTIDFGDYHIDIQFNPERIVSSAAKVDSKSIESRPCFLCRENLPQQQRGLNIDNEFIILVNPFPVFPEHLTIPSILHRSQEIYGNFRNMLMITAQLHEFVIFYNGPKCGASAPDHLHFQAGIKGILPIEQDFTNKNCCREIRRIGNVAISHWPDYQRGIITLTSHDIVSLVACFSHIYSHLQVFLHDDAEPMLNILATFDQDKWIVHVIPRTLHRPVQYFETGEKKIILSPASVDMGGVLITPREEDFFKIGEADVKDILQQVCFDQQAVFKLISQL